MASGYPTTCPPAFENGDRMTRDEFHRIGMNGHVGIALHTRHPRIDRDDGAGRRRGAIVFLTPVVIALADDDPTRVQQLITVLKSCSAFEAFVKRHGTLFEPTAITEELIRSADFPRAVRSCLAGSLDAVSRISSDQGAPHRILPRWPSRRRC